jgi:hypothetical protein
MTQLLSINLKTNKKNTDKLVYENKTADLPAGQMAFLLSINSETNYKNTLPNNS